MEVSKLNLNLKIKDVKISDVVDKENIQLHLKESLTKIIIEEGFLTFKLETNFIEPSGGNYLGELHVAQIKGNTEKGYKEINLFIKSVLPFGTDLDFLSYDDFYLREIFVYTDLNKMFEELQMTANVPESERFKLVKFYDTSNPKALVMENLGIKGFKVPKRLAIPSLSFCEIAMKQLARFHSLSFVIKKEKNEFYEKEIVTKRILMNFNDTWLGICNNFTKNSIEALQTDKAKERANKYISTFNWLDKYNYYMKNYDINIGVLCHGDYRTQNILMRQKGDASTEIMPLDYQMTYYGHPVNDIVYFIAGTTDREFRNKHMDHLTTLYYDTMKNYLLYFDIKVEDVYPRKQYEQDLNERFDYAILVGLQYLQFIFAPEDDFVDLSMDLATKKTPKSEIFIRCLNELVEDLITWGHL